MMTIPYERTQAERYLWVGEAGGWHAQVVQLMRPATHILHSADALCTGCMRQHVLACKHTASLSFHRTTKAKTADNLLSDGSQHQL